MKQPDYYPLEVAVAISLYGFNVSPLERARALYEHFDGDCAEMEELVDTLIVRKAWLATAFAASTAVVYVGFALERYGEEAKERVLANLGYRA